MIFSNRIYEISPNFKINNSLLDIIRIRIRIFIENNIQALTSASLRPLGNITKMIQISLSSLIVNDFKYLGVHIFWL